MKPQLFSGARGQIEFTPAGGQPVVLAFVTDVSISTNDNIRPSFVIGSVGPRTLEPLSEDATASIGRIIPLNDTAGAALAKMDAIENQIETTFADVLKADHVTITIYDKNPSSTTNAPKVLGSLKYARFAGKSIASSATDLATERYNFIGIWDGSYGNANSAPDVNYGMGTDAPPRVT